jgi:predicted RNA-binding Zn ribbon-like protein
MHATDPTGAAGSDAFPQGRRLALAEYMGDWLERRDEPASDLDLVVLLLNSLDLLADPSDRLTDLRWFRVVLAEVGRDDIAGALRAADLAGLRQLRESLLAVFLAESPGEAASILNPVLLGAPAVAQLVVSAAGVRLQVAPGERGLAALTARLPVALAEHVAHQGTGRLGICAARPCQCAFIDRTRAQTRRFCCTACNDRVAARLYRQRKRDG